MGSSSLRTPHHPRFRPSGLALALGFWAANASVALAERPSPDPKAGRTAYVAQCARCHGDQAKGDGLDAKRFYPRPRDLTLGVYKFRSTASGTPPSDDDLFHTISTGLPGTNMPDWQHLDEATRWQLVEYLKSLSPVFQENPPAAVPVSPDPGARAADLAKGKGLYEQLGCAACHGAAGRANGTSAAGLVDDWGMPIRPANLTQGWSYRGGDSAQAIMLRIRTGIDGAGMPSYADAVSPEDTWHLAYYVASLQEPPHWNMVAHAARIDGELPAALDDPRWKQAEPTMVQLRNAVTAEGEWQAPSTVRMLTMRALENGTAISVRLSWDDPTEDLSASSADGAQAGRQAEPDALAMLLQPAGTSGDVVTLQAWPRPDGPRLDLTYWSAAAPQPVEALAADFAAVRAGVAGGVPRWSEAKYEDGRWHLIVQRPLAPEQPAGAKAITGDGFEPVAFTVWDGGNPPAPAGEGQPPGQARAVSPWIDLALTRRKKTAQH